MFTCSLLLVITDLGQHVEREVAFNATVVISVCVGTVVVLLFVIFVACKLYKAKRTKEVKINLEKKKTIQDNIGIQTKGIEMKGVNEGFSNEM